MLQGNEQLCSRRSTKKPSGLIKGEGQILKGLLDFKETQLILD